MLGRLVTAACALAVVISCGAALADAPRTRLQALTAAQAILLTPQDMPGYIQTPYYAPRYSKQYEKRVLRCAGAPRLTRPLANIYSDEYESDLSSPGAATGTVAENVVVMATPAAAAREIVALNSARGRKCQAKLSLGSVDDKVKVSVSVKDLRSPAPGVWATRERVRIKFGKHVERFVADSLSFRRGPVNVAVGFFGSDRPFRAAEERRLVKLLIERAEAQLR